MSEKKVERYIYDAQEPHEFLNYALRVRPINPKRDELREHAREHFELVYDTYNKPESHVRILKRKKQDILLVPYSAVNAEKLTDKYDHISYFIRKVGTFFKKENVADFAYEDMALEIDDAHNKLKNTLEKRKKTRQENKSFKKRSNHVPKFGVIKNGSDNKVETPKIDIDFTISKSKKEEAQENGSLFLSRLNETGRNTLLHDFIQEKYNITGNHPLIETWKITKEPGEYLVNEYQKGTLRLGNLLSAGNPFAMHEFKFIEKFTENHSKEIDTFKREKNSRASHALRRPPYI